jgi:GDP-4-dehydro-6-deoxy-D-mannose reductase
MRVLVTGAGGYIGGAITRRLAANPQIDLVADSGRLEKRSEIARRLRDIQPDAVIHAAGRTSGSADALHDANVAATANLAEAMADTAPACGLVLLSSAAQYGASPDRTPWTEAGPCEPDSDYGRSKLVAEAAAFARAPNVLSLRIFNVIAPAPVGDQAFAVFLRRAGAALAGPPPAVARMGPLDAIRDFVSVDDVTAAAERVVLRGAWGGAINVCTGVGRTIRSLILDAAARIDPALQVEAAAGAGGIDWSVGDPSCCRSRLGFTPSAALDALLDGAAAWVRANAGAGAHA